MSEEEYRLVFVRKLNYYMHLNSKTQMDLMKDLGLSSATISSWCNGKKLPRMGKIQMLADYFGIEKSDLLEERPEEQLSYNSDALKRYNLDILRELNDFNATKLNTYASNLLNIQRMEEPILVAAHNDHITDTDELEKTQADIANLKRPN